MACQSCQNVALGGPTLDQQYVDPLGADEEPRTYQCHMCGQWWWCTAEPHIGYWVQVDQDTLRAAATGRPIMVTGDTGKALS